MGAERPVDPRFGFLDKLNPEQLIVVGLKFGAENITGDMIEGMYPGQLRDQARELWERRAESASQADAPTPPGPLNDAE